MDNIKTSELVEIKTKLIKDIRNWKPQEGDAPDCFTMLHDYDEHREIILQRAQSMRDNPEDWLGVG